MFREREKNPLVGLLLKESIELLLKEEPKEEAHLQAQAPIAKLDIDAWAQIFGELTPVR